MIRLCIVHEQRMLAELMAAALRLEPNIQVVSCTCSYREALTVSQWAPYDVMLVSNTLLGNGAVALMQAVQKHNPALKVLVTGLVASNTIIVGYLEQGLSGYVLQDDSYALLVQKIRMALQGECLVSSALTQALLARLWQLKQSVRELYALQGLNPLALYADLTEREREVLSLIEQGYSNLQISETLWIEMGTVKNHVHNLLEKLGVPSRRVAAHLARQAVLAQRHKSSTTITWDHGLPPVTKPDETSASAAC